MDKLQILGDSKLKFVHNTDVTTNFNKMVILISRFLQNLGVTQVIHMYTTSLWWNSHHQQQIICDSSVFRVIMV